MGRGRMVAIPSMCRCERACACLVSSFFLVSPPARPFCQSFACVSVSLPAQCTPTHLCSMVSACMQVHASVHVYVLLCRCRSACMSHRRVCVCVCMSSCTLCEPHLFINISSYSLSLSLSFFVLSLSLFIFSCSLSLSLYMYELVSSSFLAWRSLAEGNACHDHG